MSSTHPPARLTEEFKCLISTTDQLALAATGQPGGNTNAIAVAQLAQDQTTSGQNFSQYYGTIAGTVGRDLANAKSIFGIQGDLLSQAKELRSELQDVSLDEEAAQLIQYQRAYQASAQLFKTINDMTETIMSVMR